MIGLGSDKNENLLFSCSVNRTSNFVLQNLSTYEKLIHVPNIILGAVDDDGDYDGDDGDDNYDGDTDQDHEWL